jgi:shikimate kinase
MLLIILFGLSGSGKNYVGRILRDDFGFLFYDADTDLTPEMQDAIKRQMLIPDFQTRCAMHFSRRL